MSEKQRQAEVLGVNARKRIREKKVDAHHLDSRRVSHTRLEPLARVERGVLRDFGGKLMRRGGSRPFLLAACLIRVQNELICDMRTIVWTACVLNRMFERVLSFCVNELVRWPARTR